MSRTAGIVACSALALVAVGCLLSAETDKKGDFAADRGKAEPVAIDQDRTMGYLKDICKIGPRISGTDGMAKQQELIKKHFEGLGAKVTFQKFTVRQVSRKQPTEMVNVIVSWQPDKEKRVILCSHYDTRPIADQEDDRRNWHKPFVSANDGGSGVALLMELGHHMKDLKTNVGVDFVFFDGEEYIFDNSERGDHYFLGSDHFADDYKKGKGKATYAGAVLLDMIAGKDAQFPFEENSMWAAGGLVKEVWDVAGELKVKTFVDKLGPGITDDHLGMNRAGIPTVDVIDLNVTDKGNVFRYPHWHKLTDTPENCSAETMAGVAKVLSVWMQRVK
jgi:glutaminyl-peptide cyclotransferase